MKHTISPLEVYELRYRKAVPQQSSLENLTLQEGQAVSPAAPFKTPVPGYAMAVALGFTIACGVGLVCFALYWLARIYL